MSIVSEIERKVCAMPKQFRDWFAEFYHATCSGEGRQMTDEEVETSVSTWQAATAAADAEWRGVVEKATALCDQMARDGYQNAKLEAVRELREALVQAEKLMGRKQMTQKPDNPQALADKVALVKELDAKRDDICNSLVPSDIRMMQALIAQQDAIIQKQREVLVMAREGLESVLGAAMFDRPEIHRRIGKEALTAIDNVMKGE